MDRHKIDNLWKDKSNWTLGIIYRCRDDPRVIVPRRWKWGGWTLNFDHPKAGLAGLAAMGLAVARLPEGKVGEGMSVYFICEDALSIYREVRSRGIKASKPIVGNGMWVTLLADPDGYQIHFESYTDVPEDTTYSENEH